MAREHLISPERLREMASEMEADDSYKMPTLAEDLRKMADDLDAADKVERPSVEMVEPQEPEKEATSSNEAMEDLALRSNYTRAIMSVCVEYIVQGHLTEDEQYGRQFIGFEAVMEQASAIMREAENVLWELV